ncbi:MAG: hypothetical protein H7Y38_19970 [Armatimonadetes bacterium]|nr:hypothetical protein [Armatimonadota bacterium]
MKQTVFAAIVLLLVLAGAVLHPRLSPAPVALAPSASSVVLIAVEGLPVFDRAGGYAAYPHLRERSDTGATGLIPTRNGSVDELDFDAGMRVLIAGSRSPDADAPTLLTVAAGKTKFSPTAPRPFSLRRFIGRDAVQNADRFVGSLSPEATVLIVGVTPTADALANRERVAPMILSAPSLRQNAPHYLTSPSTRNRAGLCALTDVAATAAVLVGVPETIGDGRAMRTIPTALSPGELRSRLHRNATVWAQQSREQRALPALPWVLVALVIAAIFAPEGRIKTAARIAVLAAPISLVIAAPFVPAPAPPWCVYALAATATGVFAVAGARIPAWGQRLPRLLAIVTALTVGADTLTGGTLLARTPLSYSVLEAARFYGIGNEISGLFLGAALIAVGTQPLAATLLYGGAVAMTFGAPALGADAGGFVASLVAFSVLAFRGAGRKVSAGKIVAAGVAVVVAGAAFALWDGSRPAQTRTHIGGAVVRAREQGGKSLAPMIRRKVSINAYLLIFSPWSALLAAQSGAILLRARERKKAGLLAYPPPQAGLNTGIIALLLLNDSGVVAGATCALWQGGQAGEKSQT